MTSETADLFRRLHHDGLLILPNVWDAGTARLVESLGAKALATTSAAVAWSHGYPDGDLLPTELLVATVTAIARVTSVPLTVDVEGGYASDPAAVGDTVARVIDAGAVGINLEDGEGSPDLLCAKIDAAKRAGARTGVDLFVNARTDVFLAGLAPEEGRVEETISRGERYRAAGADGLFVPAVAGAGDIRTIAAAVPLPLNVLAWPGLPAAAELEALGARRLSAGSGIARAAYDRVASLAAGFLGDGASDPMMQGKMTYAEINALMTDSRG